MCRFFLFLLLCFVTIVSKAQQSVPSYQAYGKIDKADLELKDCDFEKGARAEVLFDKGVYDRGYMDIHIRIKIFNEAGLSEGNIHLPYNSYNTGIENFKAETINLDSDKIEITPVNKKLVYTEKTNKFISSLVFAFPNVKPGSVIELSYSVQTGPEWLFQYNLPVRYSEIQISFPGGLFSYIPHINHPFTKNVGVSNDLYQDKVLTNIHSLPDEPYMRSRKDNLERMEYINSNSTFQSWARIGALLLQYAEFGGELNRNIKGDDSIIKHARELKTDNDKISFIFSQVKNTMAWNDKTNFATQDGTVKAWDRKTGNSAEINFILYDLLTEAGINASPMVVSTNINGKLNPFNPNPYSFNNTLVYIPADTNSVNGHNDYVLDATNKYNLFNKIPKDNLNTFGVIINKKDNIFKVAFLSDKTPVIQSIYVNAEIKPEGKMVGTAEITSDSYNKIDDVSSYKKDGEKKFIENLTDNDNNLQVASLQMQNMDVDTLPLTKEINFTLNLADADDNYIYFNANLFVTPHKNPFLSEERFTDIDFECNNELLINGSFKLPAGYKIDAKPKSEILTMPDNSITFKRVINEADGTIVLRYTIIYNKAVYLKSDYVYLHEFYKKMYEMLNEQIVLKKS